MNFNRKDVVIGFVLIIIIVLVAFYYKKSKTPQTSVSPTPVEIGFRNELENNFKYDIPDNVDSIELKDVSNGSGRGVATKNEVLADLDDPEAGYFYQGWLENGGEPVSIGKLQVAKGGWLIEYNKAEYSAYKKIIISLEKNFDSKIEKRILEGSFN